LSKPFNESIKSQNLSTANIGRIFGRNDSCPNLVAHGLKSSKNFIRHADSREFRTFLTREKIKQKLIAKGQAQDAKMAYSALAKS
jgi:hypothetical protein